MLIIYPPFRRVTISHVETTTDETDLTTYTPTMSFGTADDNRYLLLGTYAQGVAAAARTISSVSIGGITATEVVQNNSGNAPAGLYLAAVPTGTSGTVSVTFSGACARATFAIWKLLGIHPTPFDTGTATGDPATDTLNIPAYGVAVGCAGSNSNPTWTWTNLTEDFDNNGLGSASLTGASLMSDDDHALLSITADPNAAVTTALCLASFKPFW